MSSYPLDHVSTSSRCVLLLSSYVIKNSNLKSYFILFALHFFQLQLLFLAGFFFSCLTTALVKNEKKRGQFLLSKPSNYVFQSKWMLKFCLGFWGFSVQENKAKILRKAHTQMEKKIKSGINQPLEHKKNKS